MSIFINFEIEITPKKKLSYFKVIVRKILFFIIPKANPDFESKIDLVRTWYLEFEDQNSIPISEIGLDEKNEVILKMPFKKNYGYWTDNLLKYNDFDRLFKINIISVESYKILWEQI
jgi:hypothetical protein